MLVCVNLVVNTNLLVKKNISAVYRCKASIEIISLAVSAVENTGKYWDTVNLPL